MSRDIGHPLQLPNGSPSVLPGLRWSVRIEPIDTAAEPAHNRIEKIRQRLSGGQRAGVTQLGCAGRCHQPVQQRQIALGVQTAHQLLSSPLGLLRGAGATRICIQNDPIQLVVEVFHPVWVEDEGQPTKLAPKLSGMRRQLLSGLGIATPDSEISLDDLTQPQAQQLRDERC